MISDNQVGPMLTVREVARVLHIHTNTVRRWSDRGVLNAYRISLRGDRRFRLEDIDRILLELKAYGGSSKKAKHLP